MAASFRYSALCILQARIEAAV